MIINDYPISDIISLETLLNNTEAIYNQSGSDEDKVNYERLLKSFKNLLLRHVIISEIAAFSSHSHEIQQTHEELKEKYEHYFGQDCLTFNK